MAKLELSEAELTQVASSIRDSVNVLNMMRDTEYWNSDTLILSAVLERIARKIAAAIEFPEHAPAVVNVDAIHERYCRELDKIRRQLESLEKRSPAPAPRREKQNAASINASRAAAMMKVMAERAAKANQ